MQRRLSLSYQKHSKKNSALHSLSSVDTEVQPTKSDSGISENVVIVSALHQDTVNISSASQLTFLMRRTITTSSPTKSTKNISNGCNNMVIFMAGPKATKNERRLMGIRSSHGTGGISEKRWQPDSRNSVGLSLSTSSSKRQYREDNSCKMSGL